MLLAACASETEEINYLDPIEVEITTDEELRVNEVITTQAFVTQSGHPVSDVSEAVFEIWQHGKPETYRSELGIAIGKGSYEVTWSAAEAGVYYVYYHITAQGMHRMQKYQYVIGDVDAEKILETPDERPSQHMQ
jgi:hypothetical protein